MTRPSVALARLEDRLADVLRQIAAAVTARPLGALEVVLMLGIVALIWIGVLRTAALYPVGP